MTAAINKLRIKIATVNETLKFLQDHPDKLKGKLLSEDLKREKEILMLQLFEETIKYAKDEQ